MVLVPAANVPLFAQLPHKLIVLVVALNVAPELIVILPFMVMEAASDFAEAPPLEKIRFP